MYRHDGGSKMVLIVNDKEVCASNAMYEKAGSGASNNEVMTQMSKCENSIPIKKGDVLTLKSVYDLKTHPM
jgi:hypothetical protein